MVCASEGDTPTTQTTHHFKTMSKFNLHKGIYQYEDLGLSHFKASDFEGDGYVQRSYSGDKNKNKLVAKSNHNSALSGFDDADILRGAGGDDILDGGHGDDTLIFNGGRDVLIGGEGRDTFAINLERLTTEDTATITDFQDIGDKIEFFNVDPHLSMDIGVDGSAMVTANLGLGQRSVVAVLTGLEGDEVFTVGNSSIELIG